MYLSARRLMLASAIGLLGLVHSAQAANPPVKFPAGTAIPAQLTLFKAQGAVGRSNPIYKGYRPTFFFTGGTKDVMCAIQLPGDREKVDPGETLDVNLECIEPLSIQLEKPGFIFKEGGRTVGEGVLKPAVP